MTEIALEDLVAQAVRAPSGHNSQPWLFRREGAGTLAVLADRRRALPVVDPHDRELTISVGAAVGTLEIAARGEGLAARVEPLPEPGDPDLIARVHVEAAVWPSPEEIARARAIPARRTVRAPFAPAPVPEAVTAALREEAGALDVELRAVAGGAAKRRIAALVAEGDRRQFEDPRFRRELAAWVHSYRLGSRDGMSGAGFGMPDILAPVARFVIRSFDLGDGVAASDETTISDGSPALWLLATARDDPAAWVATGRALARIGVGLTAKGLALSYLNQPIECETLRPSLAEAAGLDGVPQILLRVGQPTAWPETTARRPVEEVMPGEGAADAGA